MTSGHREPEVARTDVGLGRGETCDILDRSIETTRESPLPVIRYLAERTGIGRRVDDDLIQEGEETLGGDRIDQLLAFLNLLNEFQFLVVDVLVGVTACLGGFC